jgi:general stress protein 26
MVCLVALFITDTQAQEASENSTEKLLSVARLVMEQAGNCALISLDKSGHPRARTMDPFLPDEDMVVWLGTNPKSRKVTEIQNDPRVTLYYFDKEGGSYVIITGEEELVDDPEMKKTKWKEDWNQFYPNRDTGYLLIKVTPETLELISPQNGVTTSGDTWQPPVVRF